MTDKAFLTVPAVAWCPGCGLPVGVEVFGSVSHPRIVGHLACKNAVHGAGGMVFRMPVGAIKAKVLAYIDQRLAGV